MLRECPKCDRTHEYPPLYPCYELEEETPDAALLAQADEYRAGVMSRADGVNAGAPWWYGWVIVEAYLAGYRAAKEETE